MLKYSMVLVLFLLVYSCKQREKTDKMVFRYNEQTGIATLDPAFAKNQSIIWPVHQIYNTLVETDSNLHIVPSLAYRWEVSADRLIYTFHLRRDVFFQDNEAFPGARGRKMNAADIVYSFERIIDKNTASSGAWIFNGRIDARGPFRALDDSTFQLHLSSPFNPILGLLSMQYCSVLPKEVVEKYGPDFRSHPCGTGPFQLKYWEEGQDLILVRNPNYFEKDAAGQRLPYLDAVKISFFENKSTEFLLFRQGQLDFVNEIDPAFKDEILSKKGELRKEWQGKIVMIKHPQLNTEYLGILTDTANDLLKHSPFRQKKIRQAINYGFDRRKMIMYLKNSIGLPAESGFIPAGLPSFDTSLVKGYSYNPEKARQLLAESGFPNGEGLPALTLSTIDIYADLAGFIAKELEDIGLKIRIDIMQKSLLLEETAQSKVLFFRASWMADYPDAENYLSVFYSGNPAPPNYTRYHNPEFDLLYERSLTEKNDSVKYDLYRQMDRLVIADAPVVPLWYDESVHLINKKLTGLYSNGLNLLDLRHVKLEKKEK